MQSNSQDVYSKKEEGSGSDVYVSTTAAPREQLYDPSQETKLTRLGLSLESFKRAPGSTG